MPDRRPQAGTGWKSKRRSEQSGHRDTKLPPIIAIVGQTDQGKTTLIERLIPVLSEWGYRIGTIKHHHDGDFEADRPGKDSWRHARAGAVASAVVGSRRLAVFQRVQREPAPAAVARLFVPPPDLILAEGYSSSPYPKVEVVRVARGSPPRCTEVDHLIALVTDGKYDLGVPRFGLDEIDAIAAHLVSHALAAEAGRSRPDAGLPAVRHWAAGTVGRLRAEPARKLHNTHSRPWASW